MDEVILVIMLAFISIALPIYAFEWPFVSNIKQPDAPTDVQTDTQPDAQPEVQPDTQPEVQPDTQPNVQTADIGMQTDTPPVDVQQVVSEVHNANAQTVSKPLIDIYQYEQLVLMYYTAIEQKHHSLSNLIQATSINFNYNVVNGPTGSTLLCPELAKLANMQYIHDSLFTKPIDGVHNIFMVIKDNPFTIQFNDMRELCRIIAWAIWLRLVRHSLLGDIYEDIGHLPISKSKLSTMSSHNRPLYMDIRVAPVSAPETSMATSLTPIQQTIVQLVKHFNNTIDCILINCIFDFNLELSGASKDIIESLNNLDKLYECNKFVINHEQYAEWMFPYGTYIRECLAELKEECIEGYM